MTSLLRDLIFTPDVASQSQHLFFSPTTEKRDTQKQTTKKNEKRRYKTLLETSIYRPTRLALGDYSSEDDDDDVETSRRKEGKSKARKHVTDKTVPRYSSDQYSSFPLFYLHIYVI